MGKHRLNITVTDETVQILKEMAEEYSSTMGTMVVMLVKNWQRENSLYIGDILKNTENKSENQ